MLLICRDFVTREQSYFGNRTVFSVIFTKELTQPSEKHKFIKTLHDDWKSPQSSSSPAVSLVVVVVVVPVTVVDAVGMSLLGVMFVVVVVAVTVIGLGSVVPTEGPGLGGCNSPPLFFTVPPPCGDVPSDTVIDLNVNRNVCPSSSDDAFRTLVTPLLPSLSPTPSLHSLPANAASSPFRCRST